MDRVQMLHDEERRVTVFADVVKRANVRVGAEVGDDFERTETGAGRKRHQLSKG